MDWHQALPYLIPVLAVALIARRVIRTQKPKRIRPSRLWIAPAALAVGMALVMSTSPMPGPAGLAMFAAAVVAGVGVGYLRALHQEFSIEPGTGNVMSKATPLGAMLFSLIFVVRFGVKAWMNGGVVQESPLAAKSAQFILYTDVTMFFALAMVSASAWEIWRRTRPLITEHRASMALPPADGGAAG